MMNITALDVIIYILLPVIGGCADRIWINRTRKKRIRENFRTTFKVALNLFASKSQAFPVSPQNFLSDVYSKQAAAVSQLETVLSGQAQERLREACDPYYHYVVNNDLILWVDKYNRLDSTDPADQSMKQRVYERLEALLAVIDD